MNILVIGSQGFIGAAAMAYFTRAGHQVFGCGVSGVESSNYFIVERGNPNYEALLQSQHFDVCINAAGSPGVSFSLANPTEDFKMNVVNVNNLLHAIRLHQPHCFFVLLSSAAVIGNPAVLPITELVAPQPLSPYGFNKWQAEILVQQYAACFGIHAVVFRIFSAYGNGLKKQLFWDIYQKAIAPGDAIHLFGTGNETRDFIFIDDVLKAIDLVLHNQPAGFELYNLASGKKDTVATAAGILLQHLEINKPLLFNQQTKPGDPLHWRAGMQRLQAIGFTAQTSLSQGLKQYAQWLQNQT